MRKYLGFLKSMKGTVGQRLKYGVESLNSYFYSVTMAASTNLYPLSSYFVTFDASGNAALTAATSTFISGAIMGVGAGNPLSATPTYYTTSSTAGADSFPCTSDLSAVFRAPVGSGTYARSNRGKLCDLVITAGVQAVATQVATRGHLRLLDGDETNNKWVIVQLNPALISGGNAS